MQQANASLESREQAVGKYHAVDVFFQPAQFSADGKVEDSGFQDYTAGMPPRRRVPLESPRDDQCAFAREAHRQRHEERPQQDTCDCLSEDDLSVVSDSSRPYEEAKGLHFETVLFRGLPMERSGPDGGLDHSKQ